MSEVHEVCMATRRRRRRAVVVRAVVRAARCDGAHAGMDELMWGLFSRRLRASRAVGALSVGSGL